MASRLRNEKRRTVEVEIGDEAQMAGRTVLRSCSRVRLGIADTKTMHPDRLNGHSNPSVGVDGRFDGFFTARLIKLTVVRASNGPRVSPSHGQY